jgi:hypothetical protein
MSVNTRTYLALAFMAACFLAGFVCALAAAHLGWLPPPRPPGAHDPADPAWAVERLRVELGLDPAQCAEARAALAEARDKAQALMESARPTVLAAVAQARQRIRASLDPSQQAKFDAMMTRMPLDGPLPGMPPPRGPPPFPPPALGPPPL